MEPLDDAKFSGTKEVAEHLTIEAAKLQPWIDEFIPEAGKIKSIEQFKGGQSNPTYKITTDSKSLVLRRKPPGKLLPSAHAVDREYKVITALYETDVPVPKTYGLCEDDDVAGTAFFVMDFLDGDLFWDPMIPSVTNKDRTEIYQNKNKTLAKLHSVDYKKIGLEDYGKPGNYVARQVSRWSKQYIDSETETIESMNNLIEWLPNNLPAEKKTGIVHGDYSLTNVMIGKNDPNVIAILDWELSTLGDPCADFNYHCLQYTMNPKLADKEYCKAQGIPVIDDYVKMYSEKINIDLTEEWDLYSAYNLFKLAGILQGILGRVRDGTAAHENAAERASGVKNLSDTAWALVEKNFI